MVGKIHEPSSLASFNIQMSNAQSIFVSFSWTKLCDLDRIPNVMVTMILLKYGYICLWNYSPMLLRVGWFSLLGKDRLTELNSPSFRSHRWRQWLGSTRLRSWGLQALGIHSINISYFVIEPFLSYYVVRPCASFLVVNLLRTVAPTKSFFVLLDTTCLLVYRKFRFHTKKYTKLSLLLYILHLPLLLCLSTGGCTVFLSFRRRCSQRLWSLNRRIWSFKQT